MKRHIRILAAALALIIGLSAPAPLMAKGWESVKSEKAHGQRVMSDSELEIMVGGGMIFVNTSRSVNIKVFTILGSRIADENLSPGSYQFAVPTHGVYIVKAGDITCKVAV